MHKNGNKWSHCLFWNNVGASKQICIFTDQRCGAMMGSFNSCFNNINGCIPWWLNDMASPFSYCCTDEDNYICLAKKQKVLLFGRKLISDVYCLLSRDFTIAIEHHSRLSIMSHSKVCITLSYCTISVAFLPW